MKNIFYIILFLAFSVVSCNSQEVDDASIGNFDISNNDKHIVFSYTERGISSIYKANIDGSEISLLLGSKKGISYVNPKFSRDGRKMIFISHPSEETNSKICVANQDGSDLVYFPFDNLIVTEAIFSTNQNLVYFCGARSFNKSSPIGIRAVHDFDIYSLNTENKKINKLTGLNYYNINNISEIDSSYILMRMEKGPTGGMYAMSIDNPEIVKAIIPANNPRNSTSLYYHPIFSDKFGIIAFIAPYELYLMDGKSKNARLVYGPKDGSGHFKSICIYNNNERLLFTKESRSGKLELMSISFNGSDLRKIPISIP